MKRAAFWVAVGIVVVANLVVLGRVAANRSGEPEAVLQMTERELSLSYSAEDTGIALRVDWQRRRPYDENRGAGWFNQSKLEAVGFDCSVALTNTAAEQYYSKALPRTVYVVFEYDGDSWQAWLAAWEHSLEVIAREVDRRERSPEVLKNARQNFDKVRRTGSRLVALDAGLDPAGLRRRYPDRSRFLVAPAIVRLHFAEARRGRDGTYYAPYLHGTIDHLLVEGVHVPQEIRGLLDQLRTQEEQDLRAARVNGLVIPEAERLKEGPRYGVTLHYGQRYEPWVVDIQPLNKPG